MDLENFEFIIALLKERSGLVLGEDKKYLVESRLKPLAAKHGMGNHNDLVSFVRSQMDEGLIGEVVDVMTTNETFFFRDAKMFGHFRDAVLPRIMENRVREKSFRIWCCAASTGQEPYTLAMILNGMADRLQGWNYRIVATDLSAEALNRAVSGVYTQFEVQRGLPVQLLVKYFNNKGEMWEIKPSLRSMIQFRELNLLDDFRGLGRFDIVFCRNVLIYFDMETKADILERIRERMPDDGTLFLGGTETVANITDSFTILPGQNGAYVPAASAKGRLVS